MSFIETMKIVEPQILVFDFGGQTAHLICRRVREMGVYSQLVPHSISLSSLRQNHRLRGLIFSGGPASTYDSGAPDIDPNILGSGYPMLGICYGMQILARMLKGKVKRQLRKEFGGQRLRILKRSSLFSKLPEKTRVWMSHGDVVEKLPAGFETIGETTNTSIAAMQNLPTLQFGVQFHPEVGHTSRGKEILKNFVFGICRAKKDWDYGQFIKEEIAAIRNLIGDKQAICGLSGGIDSATAAALVYRAIGERLISVFIDTGLMREGEREEVVAEFQGYFQGSLVVVEAGKEFLGKLRGISDPERKRRAIGETFIRIFEREAIRQVPSKPIKFLVQGTIYPDVIESAGSKYDTAPMIKSHHNVGGLPRYHSFTLVEPLRNLYKDEVRGVAKGLGLPRRMIWRHPFPGPGLAIRIRGKVTGKRLARLRLADRIVEEELRKSKVSMRDSWMTFPIYVPLPTTGVKGDGRAFEDMIAIRSLVSRDAMTAEWSRIPYSLLAKLSARIVNEVPGVTRVVYDITTKPPATMEWE